MWIPRKNFCPCCWAATPWTTCPMKPRSDGRIALVTGAGGGIGRAIAQALLGAGYRVACGYNENRVGGEKLAKADPAGFAVKIDIASRASVKRAIAQCRKRFGGDIAVLVNNAALAQEK